MARIAHEIIRVFSRQLTTAVHAWGEMRTRLDAGEITVEEYELWQDTYSSKKYVG